MLASHPNVMEAAVFGVPHQLYGEAVAAVIVPRESAPPTREELVQFCRERLAAFEIPASFQEASGLPHTAKGSLDRRAVAERFGHSVASRPRPLPGRRRIPASVRSGQTNG